MSYKAEKIKILEMICADLIPWDAFQGEFQEVILTEEDFKKEGFSFNSAIFLLRDIFTNSPLIHSLNYTTKDNINAVLLSVPSEIDSYTKELKYPETEYEDFTDSQSVISPKISVVIDENKGIYREDNQKLCYPIKTSTKRMAIISCLRIRDKVSISELEEKTGQSYNLISKEIKEINTNFRDKVKVTYDLIIHLSTSGYSLNKEKFYIKP